MKRTFLRTRSVDLASLSKFGVVKKYQITGRTKKIIDEINKLWRVVLSVKAEYAQQTPTSKKSENK